MTKYLNQTGIYTIDIYAVTDHYGNKSKSMIKAYSSSWVVAFISLFAKQIMILIRFPFSSIIGFVHKDMKLYYTS